MLTQAMEENFVLRSDVIKLLDLGLDNTDQQAEMKFSANAGQWLAEVERKDLGSSWGMRPVFLIAWHASLEKPDSGDKRWSPLGIRLHSETGIIAIADDKTIDDDNLQLYQDAVELLDENDFASLSENAVIIESAVNYGDFPLSAIVNDSNKIQAICVNFGLAVR